MCLGCPMANADNFQCNRPVETFLPGAIDHALTAAADFLQQLVIVEVCWHRHWARFGILVIFAQRSKTGLKQTQPAKSLRRVREDLAAAFTANTVRIFGSSFRAITHLHGTVPNLVRSYVCSIEMKCRNSSSTSLGAATVCAISSRNNN